VNPSGGLISKGHPLGATGLAQCYELCLQVRGEAGPRQVKGARVGLQHNLGLGGAAVVTLFKKATWPAEDASKMSSAVSRRPESVGHASAAASASTSSIPAATSAPAPDVSSSKPAPKASGGGGGGSFQAEAVFAELKKRASADLVKQVGCVYQFDITNESGSTRSWVVDLKNGSGSVTEAAGKADCTIAVKDSDFVALMTGKLNGQQAFMKGLIKVKGNVMAAQKLSLLSGAPAKL